MTNQHPAAAADAMLHEVEEDLDNPRAVAGALTAIGWALLAVEKAVREQTETIRKQEDRSIFSTR